MPHDLGAAPQRSRPQMPHWHRHVHVQLDEGPQGERLDSFQQETGLADVRGEPALPLPIL